MKYLNFTYPSPEANLACDEWLLDRCDRGEGPEVLRFWESSVPFVVLGYAKKVRDEVHRTNCRRLGIPVLRRPSGGGTVLQGPGCLNYALILRIGPGVSNITETNRIVMGHIRTALEPLLGPALGIRGDTDLALGVKKFSGSAQRRKRHALLFHGTFLLSMDLELISKTLKLPHRQPVYRQNRPHGDFLQNVNLPPELIRQSMRSQWKAQDVMAPVLPGLLDDLIREKYANKNWNFKF
ncbi:MAG: lipoate--protein ligase family protein [Candidatus Omnitrophota bacterium]